MSYLMKESKIPLLPAAPLWVPTVEEYQAMSWHQRQQFVLQRRVVEKVLVLVPCEKSHVEDLPHVVAAEPWDAMRMHHELTMAHRRQEARRAAEIITPDQGDRDWNTLAEALGNPGAVRHGR